MKYTAEDYAAKAEVLATLLRLADESVPYSFSREETKLIASALRIASGVTEERIAAALCAANGFLGGTVEYPHPASGDFKPAARALIKELEGE